MDSHQYATMSKVIESDFHRLHLKDLARQEHVAAYRRQDYLSEEWQIKLWEHEVNEAKLERSNQHPHSTPDDTSFMMQSQARQSPTSVFMPSSSDQSFFSSNIPAAPSEICIRWREKIIEWKYQVVDRFDLSREIVGISTYYLDQYLSKNFVDEEHFQLVAISSIYLAIKINSPKKVAIHSIASTGNGLITTKHIEAMELSLMKCLDWHLFPSTSIAFIENIYPLLFSNQDSSSGVDAQRLADSLEFSRFLAELSVCAYPFISTKPSSIAIAAILHSFENCGVSYETREAFQDLLRDEDICLDLDAPEIEACGKLLRQVYTLAVSND